MNDTSASGHPDAQAAQPSTAPAEPASEPERVLVVAEQLRRDVPGGIGVYLVGLLQGLTQLGHDGVELPDVTLYASRARRSPDPLMAFGRPVVSSPLSSVVLTRGWDRSVLHAPSGYGVVHASSLAVPPARKSATVVTVHDLAWRRVPEAYPRRGRRWHEAALRRAMRRASHFVVPSTAVADDLIAAGAPPGATTVIPLGTDHLPPPDHAGATALLERLGVAGGGGKGTDGDGGFLLSVGTLEPRKNLRRLFDACAVARPSLPCPWPLVVVGPTGWGAGTAPRDGVVFTGEVRPEVLAALYRRTRMLVYVPLVEGFGLPPVEAMRMGTPVVASDVPSTGGAALVVDPDSTEEIASAIVAVASDEGLCRDLSARGEAHAGSLTWRAAARTHVRLWDSFG
jgi:glycosyltransferase involved in cell wall biosynthesis